ncbi:uncharacterized protein LOC124185965 [Neodiprion fabricii]|uniref:uncharacterized protein LOC124185965 n=1 Tax=Neodiprion fabricii TaxID=2872261 RepID=UPI001ED8FC5E|nr:uncharacterized protein LOC124185965 [Neodiprion fabricii]
MGNYDPLNIDEHLEIIPNIIMKSAESTIQKTTDKSNKAKLSWWKKECDEALKNTKHAKNIYKRDKTEKTKREYNKARATSKRIILNCQRKGWLEFVEGINSQSSTKEVWDQIRRIGGKTKSSTFPYLMKENNEILENDLDIANEFAQQYAQNSSDNNYTRDFIMIKQREEAQAVDLEDEENIQQVINMPQALGQIACSTYSSKTYQEKYLSTF